MDHDEAVRTAVAVAARTDVAVAASAWVSSLTTRDLAARSAFGSAVVLGHLPEHGFTPSAVFHPSSCGVCGLGRTVAPAGPPTHPLRHTDVTAATADLTAFAAGEQPTATAEDVDRLRAVLDAIRALPATAQLTDLHGALRGTLRSNKWQRVFLLEQLGFAGVLCPADQRHYSAGWVTWDHASAAQPPQHGKREWDYPVRWWTGADGVDDELVGRYFASV